MAKELAYVLINPYTIRKSRTGGVIARYLSRTDLRLVGARMFGPSQQLAAEYAHVTAPLRRLVDRYGLEICLAACAGTPLPEHVLDGLEDLPQVMADGNRRAGAYERGAVAVIEALVLEDHVGEVFEGVAIDVDERRQRNGRQRGSVMLAEPAVEAPVFGEEIPLGEEIQVRLATAEPATGTVTFDLV